MAQPQTAVTNPAKPEAQKWQERHEEYQSTRNDPLPMHWLYAFMHEPDVWVLAMFTVVVGCLIIPAGVWFYAILMPVMAYWVWALARTPRVVRKYNKLVAQGDILVMPELLKVMYGAEIATYPDMVRVGTAAEQRRHSILKAILREQEEVVDMVNRDCDCEEECTHAGRLSSAARRGAHRILQEAIRGRLAAAARTEGLT